MFKAILRPHSTADKLVAILTRAKNQTAASIEIRFALRSETIAPFPVAEDFPLGWIELLLVEFVSPREFPLLTCGQEWKRVSPGSIQENRATSKHDCVHEARDGSPADVQNVAHELILTGVS